MADVAAAGPFPLLESWGAANSLKRCHVGWNDAYALVGWPLSFPLVAGPVIVAAPLVLCMNCETIIMIGLAFDFGAPIFYDYRVKKRSYFKVGGMGDVGCGIHHNLLQPRFTYYLDS